MQTTVGLRNIAKNIRIDVVKSLTEAGSGHLGASLGLADVFASLYFSVLNHKPDNPKWEERDRLIVSIGHIAPVYYAALAHAGYFPQEELKTLRKLNSRLQGHPGKDKGLPGIELSSGSLGQGLSVAVGIALSAKMDKQQHRSYCLMGDGELQEGSVWEAAMSAAHYKLDNLIAIIDRNYCQIDGATEEVMSLGALEGKWSAFGWHVINCDANNVESFVEACSEAESLKGKPVVIIGETKMGKGVPEIEDDYTWHGKVPNASQLDRFISEIEKYG